MQKFSFWTEATHLVVSALILKLVQKFSFWTEASHLEASTLIKSQLCKSSPFDRNMWIGYFQNHKVQVKYPRATWFSQYVPEGLVASQIAKIQTPSKLNLRLGGTSATSPGNDFFTRFWTVYCGLVFSENCLRVTQTDQYWQKLFLFAVKKWLRFLTKKDRSGHCGQTAIAWDPASHFLNRLRGEVDHIGSLARLFFRFFVLWVSFFRKRPQS